jgi:hypothetical protein
VTEAEAEPPLLEERLEGFREVAGPAGSKNHVVAEAEDNKAGLRSTAVE